MGGDKIVLNFINSISGEEKPLSNPDEALKLMKIIDAIYQSASTKAPIKIR